jgi:peptidylprolyl isomerase
MKIGDKKVVDIPFMEGYGPLNDQMIIEFPLDQFPPDLGEPTIGMMLHLSDPEGNQLPVTITEIKEGTFVLDGNHPLAGKDLTFDIELVEIIG